MENMTTEQLVEGIRSWALERFDMEKMPIGDCRALYEEYAEWIEPQGEELEIVSMEEITPTNLNVIKSEPLLTPPALWVIIGGLNQSTAANPLLVQVRRR